MNSKSTKQGDSARRPMFERGRRRVGPIAWTVAVMLLGVSVAGCEPEVKEAEPLPIDVERFRVDVADDDYALGPDTALVTIVVFSDYACVPCSRTWTVLEHLQEDYGEDIRVVHRSATVPGFTQGESASEAAFAAGAQGKFWEMHRRLFANPADFSRPVLRAHAEAIGLDVPRFMDELDEGKYSGRRARDRRQATRLGIRALPAYFINGIYLLSAPKGEEDLRPIIDNELAMARKMIAQGAQRNEVYAELMRTASEKAVGENDMARELRADRKERQEAARAPINTPKRDQRYALPTGPDAGAAAMGPADAPVVVVEFVDFQCPFCRKNVASVEALRERFPDQVRVEIRHLPLEIHPAAAGAARAAIAAQQQDKFWDFHDRLFEEKSGFGYESYLEHCRELGMDVEQFKKDLQDPATEARVAADKVLARQLGVGATPAAFVNGYYLEGYQSTEAYAEVVERELEAAAKLAATGVGASEMHDALMKDAITPDQFPNAGSSPAKQP